MNNMEKRVLFQVISGTDRTPKNVCNECADELFMIHESQPVSIRSWFPYVRKPEAVGMGECPNCAMRKVRDRIFDPER